MKKPNRKQIIWMKGHPLMTVFFWLVIFPITVLVVIKRLIDKVIMRLID